MPIQPSIHPFSNPALSTCYRPEFDLDSQRPMSRIYFPSAWGLQHAAGPAGHKLGKRYCGGQCLVCPSSYRLSPPGCTTNISKSTCLKFNLSSPPNLLPPPCSPLLANYTAMWRLGAHPTLPLFHPSTPLTESPPHLLLLLICPGISQHLCSPTRS